MEQNTFFRSLASLLFPVSCVACGRGLGRSDRYRVICNACFARIPRTPYPQCPTCGARCTEMRARCHSETPFVLLAATEFATPTVRDLIHALKYRGLRDAAAPLADLLAEHLGTALETLGAERESFLLVPAPLHPRRARARGLDQTVLIARALVERLPRQFTLAEKVLARIRDTDSQTEQPNREARFRNVLGSFAVMDPAPLKGANVVVLDDVCTSGATMAEMVRTVRHAQPRILLGATVARA